MITKLLFRVGSIHSQITIAFFLLILLIIAILSFSAYRISADTVTKNTLDNTVELIGQVKRNIETYIENVEYISTLVANHADLKEYVTAGSEEREVLHTKVHHFFKSLVLSRNDIASILFLGANGVRVSDRSNEMIKDNAQLKKQDWYVRSIEEAGSTYISSSHVQHIFHKEYRWVISISRLLDYGRQEGEDSVLLVDLNFNVIDDLCKQIELGQRGYVFVLDSRGEIVYHPQQQIIYTNLKSEDIQLILDSKEETIQTGKGSESKIYTVSITDFGWKIVGVTYPNELIQNKTEIQAAYALLGLLSLCAALGISLLVANRITRPLKNLDIHMKEVEKGDFHVRVNISGPREIGKLARTFNLMIEKIRMLMDQIVEEQEMKRKSELKALQAQIQPHFLYNTLDSIIWMAEMGKMDSVIEMTSSLAKLLRSSISKGEELVPIREELEHIENYLTIQSYRYRNKLFYSIEVDETLYEHKILKLILQPLVENAIYHGIRNMAEPGWIRITGQRVNGMIELKICDNGVGTFPEKVREKLKKPFSIQDGQGVGLHNVNHRIKLYFGDHYGLEFDSVLDEGSVVTVRIPELE